MTHLSSVPSPSLPGTGIYLDHAATSPVCPEAAEAVLRGMNITGNPSSRHAAGDEAKEALESSRAQLAALLDCGFDEVVFTGGGSEADALAVVGTVLAAEHRGAHVITTAIEHSAVLESAAMARELGAEVTVLRPDSRGWIDPDDVRKALRPNTVLVSVMHANNETGVLQPVADIADIAHQAGVLMHTDAVQTAGKVSLTGIGADLVSVSAHKFYGPKGVGALKVASGVRLAPLIRGGSQERGMRAGTENVPGVLGMGAAASAALRHVDDPAFEEHRHTLRVRLLKGLEEAGGIEINGAGAPCVPETLNVSFAGVRGDTLVDILAVYGICVSAGSACHAGSDEPSHVLTAMGIPAERARSSVRFSPGRTTTVPAVEEATARVVEAVARLRALGPADVPQPAHA
ncbi:cysteine desulfurase family protein [Streptomyces sp. IB2014 016-6]|uniref:cysteine desulfurase family protein n=1 Tax=Streptomyces sp. IB2014 016-6 TaxID=2517818 RepID=UPI0011CAD6F1|nr:cysteine desulfurase family protein [Streptomyces sp. IB2014 016-6]TXL83698.1 cysteine desulfurase [Streptomyces sp. IB2014 016-6]